MKIASAAQCREIDRRSTEEFGVPSLQLMENAGAAVWKVASEYSGPVFVLCGPGNNGGDGFVVARLAQEAGRDVTVFCTVDKAALKGDAAIMADLYEGPILGSDPKAVPQAFEMMAEKGIIIDAILGIGANRKLDRDLAYLCAIAIASAAPVIAVDVPSGIHCDTGQELGGVIKADKTVTFEVLKPCFFQPNGREAAGEVIVANIGFAHQALEIPALGVTMDDEWARQMMPERLPDAHKVSAGRLLVCAGSDPMPGAAVLCVEAAYRAGAGMVQLAAPESVCQVVLAKRPETLLVKLDGSGSDPEKVIKASERADAALFGPGLGDADALLSDTWANWKLPTCLDADALNAVSRGVSPPEGVVMTPHTGELSRLIGESSEEIESHRFESASAAASQFDSTVLLKGPNSITAHPIGPLIINTTGNPGMATAGMGDVLAGVIGALLAQGLVPRKAAALGAYWHGLAGDICAEKIGPVGYTAFDVAMALPEARATIQG
jgi:NAD(P)H-hydrate epimerase